MKAKRYRVPEAKHGQLRADYGREDRYSKPGVIYSYSGTMAGPDGSRKADARLLSTVFEGIDVETGQPIFGGHGHSLVKELEARGYDLTTLRFTVQKTA